MLSYHHLPPLCSLCSSVPKKLCRPVRSGLRPGIHLRDFAEGTAEQPAGPARTEALAKPSGHGGRRAPRPARPGGGAACVHSRPGAPRPGCRARCGTRPGAPPARACGGGARLGVQRVAGRASQSAEAEARPKDSEGRSGLANEEIGSRKPTLCFKRRLKMCAFVCVSQFSVFYVCSKEHACQFLPRPVDSGI